MSNSEQLNKMIDAINKTPAQPKSSATPLPQTSNALVASAVAQAVQINEQLPIARQVAPEVISEVVAREERAQSSEGTAARAVMNFASTIENPATNRPTTHTDLLPPNHPLSTAWISVFRVRKATARYFASSIDDEELSALVASAIEAEPETALRKFYVEVLKTKTLGQTVLADIAFADEIIALKSK
ncbi:MAG: hypothetical protein ACRC5T_03770 [Cetobacterium sp.]